MSVPFQIKQPEVQTQQRELAIPHQDTKWLLPNRPKDKFTRVVMTPSKLVVVLLVLLAVTEVAEAQPLIIVGEDNLESVAQLESNFLKKVFGAVMQVENTEQDVQICTAVRLTQSLVMTNYHCDRGCEAMVFHSNNGPYTVRSQCQQQIASNENLAFSIYRVSNTQSLAVEELIQRPIIQSDESKGGSRNNTRIEQNALANAEEPTIGASPESTKLLPIMTLLDRAPRRHERLILPSYPVDETTMVVDQSGECRIDNPLLERQIRGRTTATHSCDTVRGSSGAPLLTHRRVPNDVSVGVNASVTAGGAMIGLHWGGSKSLGNLAVPTYLIIADLKRRLETKDFEELRIEGAP